MRVHVELYASLRRFAPAVGRLADGRLVCQLTPGATVAALLEQLGLPPETDMVIGVNGTLGSRDSVLAEGDEVVFVPPLRGGGA